jgi:NAD(P)H-dependent FMN reductase
MGCGAPLQEVVDEREDLRTAPGVEVDLADFREFEMPMYDGDLETRDGIPAGGREFIRRIQDCDGKLTNRAWSQGCV